MPSGEYDPDLFLDDLIEGSMDDQESWDQLWQHEDMGYDPAEADPHYNPYDDNLNF